MVKRTFKVQGRYAIGFRRGSKVVKFATGRRKPIVTISKGGGQTDMVPGFNMSLRKLRGMWVTGDEDKAGKIRIKVIHGTKPPR